MEKYNLKDDVKVFGTTVKTFPAGVGEAFDSLVKMIPGGFNRPYYGIAEMNGSKMNYYATALETFDGEAEKYHCEEHIIEKGDYLGETVKDWRNKTDCIKDVFKDILRDGRVDATKPAVEWYKDNEEMVCMVKMK